MEEDCFPVFNPDEQLSYNDVVENWTKVLLRLPTEVLQVEKVN